MAGRRTHLGPGHGLDSGQRQRERQQQHPERDSDSIKVKPPVAAMRPRDVSLPLFNPSRPSVSVVEDIGVFLLTARLPVGTVRRDVVVVGVLLAGLTGKRSRGPRDAASPVP